jgi:hypothetical protein
LPEKLGLGVAFFPWLHVQERVTFGEFTLVPYSRRCLPSGAGSGLQVKLDRATESYLTAHERPIDRATLLKIGPRGLPADLDRPRIERLFRMAELVAAAGLSTRQFFVQAGYWNRDNFRLAIELFTGRDGFVSVVSRRREGRRINIVSAKLHRIYKPDHVSLEGEQAIDVDLLTSLLEVQDSPKGARYVESILGFNQANTDNPYMTESAELVLLCGAFERLLDCGHREDDLTRALLQLLPVSYDTAPTESPRVAEARARKQGKSYPSVRESWVRDFVRVRHKPAHGRLPADYDSVWDSSEHLLLGTYLFPLALKAGLARDALYTMTDEDNDRIHAFEEILCLEKITEKAWNDVIRDAGFKRATKLALADWSEETDELSCA